MINILHPNLQLHWVSDTAWYASLGFEIWRSLDQGLTWTRIAMLNKGILGRIARRPFLGHILRLGVYNLLPLKSGTILCVANRKIYRSTDGGSTFTPVFDRFRGRRPLRMGMCEDRHGNVFLGEYWLNKEREPVRLWNSQDDGQTWDAVYTWPAGEIRHIHLVQSDPYDDLLWVATGDQDEECRILCSRDGGASFEKVGGGSQDWRTVSLLFTTGALFWGTDIGIDVPEQENFIYRLDRRTHEIKQLHKIVGPCYYSTKINDEVLILGSAVENINAIHHKCVHLYWSHNEVDWQHLALWEKWPLPGLFGPATITFPLSSSPQSRLLFNVQFVTRNNGSLIEAKL
jgi:hypothetical protein